MASLKLRQALIIDGLTIEGDRNVNQTITLDGGTIYRVADKVIADDFGEDVLWATGNGGLATFTHGWIISTNDVWVQLRNTDTGTVEYARLFVKANVLTFLPGRIGGNTTDAFDGSVLVENTDWAEVDQVEVMRDEADGEGDATVSLVLAN